MLKKVLLVTGMVISFVTFGQAPTASFSSVPAAVAGTITICQGIQSPLQILQRRLLQEQRILGILVWAQRQPLL